MQYHEKLGAVELPKQLSNRIFFIKLVTLEKHCEETWHVASRFVSDLFDSLKTKPCFGRGVAFKHFIEDQPFAISQSPYNYFVKLQLWHGPRWYLLIMTQPSFLLLHNDVMTQFLITNDVVVMKSLCPRTASLW